MITSSQALRDMVLSESPDECTMFMVSRKGPDICDRCGANFTEHLKRQNIETIG